MGLCGNWSETCAPPWLAPCPLLYSFDSLSERPRGQVTKTQGRFQPKAGEFEDNFKTSTWS